MKLLYLPALCLLLQACGGGNAPDEAASAPASCAVTAQRQSLREFMDQQYYWSAQMGTPDEAAASLDGYFQSMLYKPLDRYSFTQTALSFNQRYTEGVRVGYGYSLAWGDEAGTVLRVRSVEALSPAAAAGLQRGDTVLSIDGASPQEVASGLLPPVTTAGVERHFRVRTAGGAERQYSVTSAEFKLSPVAATATFDVVKDGAPVKVGYIAYDQFVTYSVQALAEAFTGFAGAGVSELILDLRYNGGGSVAVARDLASMIGGSRTAGRMFAYLRFNEKQTANNSRYLFNSDDAPGTLPLPQGLARVVVIASGGTASAAELLVHGLRPFIDVVLVGETTYGKPYGVVPRTDCGITYSAVQFETLNAQGTGGYTSGFVPNCQASDDLDRQLGDPAERRTRVALDYLATGRCAQAPQSARARRSPAPASGEVAPPQMFVE